MYMKRYESTGIYKRWDGKRVYKVTIYPDIPELDTDIFVISNEGDYLDTLAYQYYNDPTLWWIIARANNIGKGKLAVEGGLQLRIPQNINSLINELNLLNEE